MNHFEDQLLRLKREVELSEDQDVAALLGMTKAAFSERKRRNAFPGDKLWALATQRPDLKLDVTYILTGIEGAAQALLDAKQTRIIRAVDAGMGVEEVRAMERVSDPASVEALTALLHDCRATERAAVFTLLSSIVRLRQAPVAAQPKAARSGRK